MFLQIAGNHTPKNTVAS